MEKETHKAKVLIGSDGWLSLLLLYILEKSLYI